MLNRPTLAQDEGMGLMANNQLKQIIERNDTPVGRVFDGMIQALVVFSLLTFSLDTLPNLPAWAQSFLSTAEIVTVSIFTVEYVLRVYVATPRTGYIFGFFGVIDLLAIAPFYIGLGVDLRAVRAFRLLRLFRMFKLARYSAAVRRFHLALGIAKEEIVLFLGAAVIVLFLAAVGIYHFEREAQPEAFASVFHCLWWSLCTLTTVGYGDVFPVTAGGKLFTFFVLLVGLGVIAVPAGLVASALAKAREMEDAERRQLAEEVLIQRATQPCTISESPSAACDAVGDLQGVSHGRTS